MALKQRQLNKQAIEFAVAVLRDADFDQIFPDQGNGSEKDEQIMAKAQSNAIKRILSLINTN